ncbi:MAG TPA: T9SS type A sorting domain-containing protein, partial [Saprospiraceae bacterium]|nr:T9SS type A sorting domain-containing protein [Saprospiraceae bacterium]
TTSTEINPTVVYTNEGKYDVKLVVSNFAGKDSITKTEFIQIGGVATHDLPLFISDLNLFPNPATGDEITVEFTLDKKREMAFVLYDIRGQQYTTIHNQRVKEGRNVFYFSSESLSSGNYILKLVSKADGLTQTLPFVVSR